MPQKIFGFLLIIQTYNQLKSAVKPFIILEYRKYFSHITLPILQLFLVFEYTMVIVTTFVSEWIDYINWMNRLSYSNYLTLIEVQVKVVVYKWI